MFSLYGESQWSVMRTRMANWLYRLAYWLDPIEDPDEECYGTGPLTDEQLVMLRQFYTSKLIDPFEPPTINPKGYKFKFTTR